MFHHHFCPGTLYQDTPCRIAFRHGFPYRAPEVDFARPYIACLGSAHTFGRGVEKPYPELLGELTGRQVANFGYGQTSPRLLRACLPLMRLSDRADLCVLQVPPLPEGVEPLVDLMKRLRPPKLVLYFSARGVNAEDSTAFPSGVNPSVWQRLCDHAQRHLEVVEGKNFYPDQATHVTAAERLAREIARWRGEKSS